MNRILLAAVATFSLFSLSACSDDDVTGPATNDSGFEAVQGLDTELKPGMDTIAEIAEAEGFSLLLAAVGYIAETNPESGLVAGLLNDDPYTVFAPTDTAFENLVAAVTPLLDPDVLANEGPFAAIDALLGEGTIEAVVSYHVTNGRRAANSVVPRMGERKIQTLLPGASFTVDSNLMIDAVGSDAMIGPANISASNGIIHVIDTVLLPIDLGL